MGNEVAPLTDVLKMLAVGVGLGPVLAFLFERIGWFQNLAPKVKFWLVFGISIVVPLVAQVLVQFVPSEVWAMLEPYWQSLAAGFVIWASSQVAHVLINKSKQNTNGGPLG